MSVETVSPEYTAIIADDHQIVRQGLRVALETKGLVERKGISVVAEAENGFEAIAEVKTHKPHVLLLDIAMPLAGGAEVVNDIQRWSPDTKIVVLTGINAPGLVCNLLDAGVDGMFSKGSDMQELYEKLPLIIRGTRYIAQSFVDLMESYNNSQSLTEREKQTLNMIIAGKTNKEIANILVISPKTVDKHRTSLMNKLNVHSIAELITYALRNGLIDPDHTS
ncbi:response regulator transcription factor [uncultured Cocleimonas sp.]|uniref:response regulator n=1 Tax=uncultured Cocleimonas sp. TaxID=1051587 RepID=UPI00260EC209|nr:response regulator transcription factor [uncultured Cocleimonas sp.]